MKILIDVESAACAPTKYTSVKTSCWNDVIEIDDGNVVVFNTFHHTAVLLSSEEYNEILDGKHKWKLYSLGILVDENIDERQIWNDIYLKAKYDMSYIDITVVLTEKCQFGCIYCYEGLEKSNRVIRDKTIDGIKELVISHAKELKRLRLTWFGGEPLLAYNKICQISRIIIPYCKTYGIEFRSDITTNGYALTQERIREMVYDLHVTNYIITIDGPENMHNHRRPLRSGNGTFRKIWNNIKLLVEQNVFVVVRITIDSRNVNDVPRLIDLIKEEGLAGRVELAFCRTIDFAHTPIDTMPYIYSEEEFSDIEWHLMEYAHSQGVYRYHFPYAAPRGGCLRDGDVVIGTEGEIYKCLDTVGQKQWIFGNISLKDNTEKTEWLSKWRSWTPDNMKDCRECVLQPLCNGGCPHNALFEDKKHGTLLQCPDWKANYKRQIRALVNEYEQTI